MGSCACTVLGSAVLALLLAGYLGQRFLPPPKPKIVGIDLGTTYSCIGAYHAVTGRIDIFADDEGHRCIPSVVAFSGSAVLVGYDAVAQAEHNPSNTVYDAKRFIGKRFSKDEFDNEVQRYPFKMELDSAGLVHYVVNISGEWKVITPEDVGKYILTRLRKTAEQNLTMPVIRAVMSVPAEFDERQRNCTRLAAKAAGIEVLRVINEPTAAALAYGLHNRPGVHDVLVVDLGGGTLDVSLLDIQGGMFLTRAMAGNNHLGGQDFNQRLHANISAEIFRQFGHQLANTEDVQALRTEVERAKLALTYEKSTLVTLHLHFSDNGEFAENRRDSITFQHRLTRSDFESLNRDLFDKIREPIDRVLLEAQLLPSDVEEVVLVGGSTRIPFVRQLIRDYFGGRDANVAIDPELAVVTGVSVQAGILGGMWPLTVSAIEAPTAVKKIRLQ